MLPWTRLPLVPSSGGGFGRVRRSIWICDPRNGFRDGEATLARMFTEPIGAC